MKMLHNGMWGCRRYWYSGPPLARGLYRYRNHYHLAFRPMLRLIDGVVLFGTQRNYFCWRWRYDS